MAARELSTWPAPRTSLCAIVENRLIPLLDLALCMQKTFGSWSPESMTLTRRDWSARDAKWPSTLTTGPLWLRRPGSFISLLAPWTWLAMSLDWTVSVEQSSRQHLLLFSEKKKLNVGAKYLLIAFFKAQQPFGASGWSNLRIRSQFLFWKVSKLRITA